ncbi:MAG: HNH endonuclease signature motif containing protein [Bacteroidota bacterium]
MPNIIAFRNSIPSRSNPSIKPNHTDYFEDLRNDFNCRCGYCDSFDLRRNNDFEVEHFRPQRVLNLIAPNEYSNLIYSCKSCNRAKSGTWPSNDENVNLVGNTGFIDPVETEYENHFIRYDDGEIDWNTELGKWMYRELALFNIQHSILWMLERLRNSIDEAKRILKEDPENLIKKDALIALYEYEEVYLNKLFNVK